MLDVRLFRNPRFSRLQRRDLARVLRAVRHDLLPHAVPAGGARLLARSRPACARCPSPPAWSSAGRCRRSSPSGSARSVVVAGGLVLVAAALAADRLAATSTRATASIAPRSWCSASAWAWRWRRPPTRSWARCRWRRRASARRSTTRPGRRAARSASRCSARSWPAATVATWTTAVAGLPRRRAPIGAATRSPAALAVAQRLGDGRRSPPPRRTRSSTACTTAALVAAGVALAGARVALVVLPAASGAERARGAPRRRCPHERDRRAPRRAPGRPRSPRPTRRSCAPRSSCWSRTATAR